MKRVGVGVGAGTGTRREDVRSVVASKINTGGHEPITQLVGTAAAAVQHQLECPQRVDTARIFSHEFECIGDTVQAFGRQSTHRGHECAASERQVGIVESSGFASTECAEKRRDAVVMEERQRDESTVGDSTLVVGETGRMGLEDGLGQAGRAR